MVEIKFQTENTIKSLASNLKLKIILSLGHSLFLLSFHKEMLTKTFLKRVSDLLKAMMCMHMTLYSKASLRNFQKELLFKEGVILKGLLKYNVLFFLDPM